MIRQGDINRERTDCSFYWTPITEAEFQIRVAIERQRCNDDVPVLSAAEIAASRLPREARVEMLSRTLLPMWLANYERSSE